MDELVENKNTAATGNDEKKIKIKLKIAERSYSFNIRQGITDEERIRKAINLVNEETERCRRKHKCPDSQDALSLAIMTFALKDIDREVMYKELSDLNVDIENYLQIHEKK
ncbi:MAG: cell division protein ZapA [Prevotellaceae bacterium]|nr:cell division protein ZapA [Prevotellaceae bacterium]